MNARLIRAYRDGTWLEVEVTDPLAVRQLVNNGEIGGEMHDRVLTDHLLRSGLTVTEAAITIDNAFQAGYLKKGFWDARNWAPGYPERELRGRG